MGRERGWAFLIALVLHAAVVALALQIRPPAPPPRPIEELPLPLRLWKSAAAAPAQVTRHAPPHPIDAALIPEREVIAQGHGVTMTIQGGGRSYDSYKSYDSYESYDSAGGVSIAAHPAEPWLWAEVFVPTAPDTAPRPSDYCRPLEMPEFAADREITGRVEMEFTVDSDGVASGIVQQRDAPLALSKAVRAWLAGCAFEPATERGRPVPARIRQTFVFKIR